MVSLADRSPGEERESHCRRLAHYTGASSAAESVALRNRHRRAQSGVAPELDALELCSEPYGHRKVRVRFA